MGNMHITMRVMSKINADYCFPCSSYICSFNKSPDLHLALHSEQTKDSLSLDVSLLLLYLSIGQDRSTYVHNGFYIGIRLSPVMFSQRNFLSL